MINRPRRAVVYKKDRFKAGRSPSKKRAMIICAAAITVVAAVCIVILLTQTQRVSEGGSSPSPAPPAAAYEFTIGDGVFVNGIDVSGMTKTELLDATFGLQDELLSDIQISISLDGSVTKFSGSEMGLSTNYEDVIDQVMAFNSAVAPGEAERTDFTVSVTYDRQRIAAALLPLKEAYDIAPVDAAPLFMPWGYTEDGSSGDPGVQAMIEACAAGKWWSRPDLVQVLADAAPNKLRYEYWKNTKYVRDYIPHDARVSRFQYTEAQSGRSYDVQDTVDKVAAQVTSGQYATIIAKTETVEPAVNLDTARYNTQLVASWTSSYSTHNGFARNWNVAKLSGIINGAVIRPGEEWSINETAGNRTVKSGWKEAAGIESGGYTLQAGGGVCQISSTLYNAAIRAGLDITDATHHSIRSNYIPIGLDATISSGGPDLKIKNPCATPVYIVSYVNPKDQNVTVEIYGPPVTDPEYGEVILRFSSEDLGTYGTEEMVYIYNAAKCPEDGRILKTGESYTFAAARPGHKARTFRHLLSLQGKELKKELFTEYNWRPIKGKTYVNGPDPSLAPVPTPTPEPMPAPTPEPVPEPEPLEPAEPDAE